MPKTKQNTQSNEERTNKKKQKQQNEIPAFIVRMCAVSVCMLVCVCVFEYDDQVS